MLDFLKKKIQITPIIIIAVLIFSMLASYFGGNFIENHVNYSGYNTVEVIGKVYIDKKVALSKDEIKIKLTSIHYTEDGLLADKRGVSHFGASRDMKKNQVITVSFISPNLPYEKSGAEVDLICKESMDEIFRCEYKIPPMKLCPVPTPTPKPTATPKKK